LTRFWREKWHVEDQKRRVRASLECPHVSDETGASGGSKGGRAKGSRYSERTTEILRFAQNDGLLDDGLLNDDLADDGLVEGECR
jgi:hypothetical protein